MDTLRRHKPFHRYRPEQFVSRNFPFEAYVVPEAMQVAKTNQETAHA